MNKIKIKDSYISQKDNIQDTIGNIQLQEARNNYDDIIKTRNLFKKPQEETPKYPYIDRMDKANSRYKDKHKQVRDSLNTRNYDLNKTTKLSTGDFRNVNVPTELIEEIVTQADAANLPREDALTLIARESTFGEGKNPGSNTKRKDWSGNSAYTPIALGSYWNYGYLPDKADMHKYLSTKDNTLVEKDPTNKDPRVSRYRIPNTEADSSRVEQFLKDNPKVLEQYEKGVDKYSPNTENLYKQMFDYYKTGKYNNTKNYKEDSNRTKQQILQEPEFKKYLK